MPQERTVKDFVKLLSPHRVLMGLIVLVVSVGTLLGASVVAGDANYEAKALVLGKAGAHVVISSGSASTFADPGYDPTHLIRNAKILMTSLAVADRVKQRAATETDPAIKGISQLERTNVRGMVKVDNQEDLFFVTAQAPTVGLSTWLANTWAQQSVAAVNEAYAGSSTFAVKDAETEAQRGLSIAEQQVQEDQMKNPVMELKQQLAQAQSLLDVAAKSNTDVRLMLYKQQRDLTQAQENQYVTYASSLNQQLLELQALRKTIEHGGDDSDSLLANQLALTSVVQKVLVGNGGTQVQLQVNDAVIKTTPRSKAAQLKNMDSIVAAVQTLQSDLQTQAKELQVELDKPQPVLTAAEVQAIPPAVQQQIEQVKELSIMIEKKTFEINQLAKTRDRSQSVYDLLLTRQAEQQLNGQFSSVIDVAQLADTYETAHSRNPQATVLLATGIGLLFAIVLAVIVALLLSLVAPGFSTNARLWRRRRHAASGSPPKVATDGA